MGMCTNALSPPRFRRGVWAQFPGFFVKPVDNSSLRENMSLLAWRNTQFFPQSVNHCVTLDRLLNRCWCGDCDLLDEGHRFDRHGTTSCTDHPCTGEASRDCGAYDAFSLYYRGTCGEYSTSGGDLRRNPRWSRLVGRCKTPPPDRPLKQ